MKKKICLFTWITDNDVKADVLLEEDASLAHVAPVGKTTNKPDQLSRKRRFAPLWPQSFCVVPRQ
jgi:hypothetical protein